MPAIAPRHLMWIVSELCRAVPHRDTTHGIETFEWPAHSSDLNLIEHAWKMIKDNLHVKFPGLIFMLRNEENKTYFVNCVREAWWVIPQEKTDVLIRFTPRRLAAVRRAYG